MRQAILSYKYEGEFARSNHLAELIQPLLASVVPDTLLVPVPLHKERERRRGYNQAALLARDAGKVTGLPVHPLLVRTRATPQQIRLSSDERATNVKGAFTVIDSVSVSGKRLILVDDVFTTGSTLGECAEVLKRSGADWVGAVTVARER